MITSSNQIAALAALAILPMTACSGTGGLSHSIPPTPQTFNNLAVQSAAQRASFQQMASVLHPNGGALCPQAAAPYPPAPGNLIPDGDFHKATAPNGIVTYYPGPLSTSLQWTVEKYNVDLVDSGFWPTPAGIGGTFVCTVDLDGSPGAGGIRRTFPTVPNHTYFVRFMLSGSAPPPGQNHVHVSAYPSPNGMHNYVWSTANGHDVYNNKYHKKCFHFLATSTKTTLQFRSGDQPKKTVVDGPVIAEVAVTANGCN